MKNLFKTYVLIAICLLSVKPISLFAYNYEGNKITKSQECVSNEEIINYVIKLRYTNPEIIEEIGCDRIVETSEALLYVKVAGGRIIGAEIIGN